VTEPRTFTLTGDDSRLRLDRYLTQALPDLSRTQIQRLIATGLVTVDGRAVKASHQVSRGEIIVVEVPPPEPIDISPEAIPLEIIYENDHLLVINKPPGMVVHPAAGHTSGTLVNAVLAHCPDLAGVAGVARPGIVHRLDKDTSGLILVAKDDLAHSSLQAQFKRREIYKAYLALLEGRPPQPSGLIEAPIGRDPRQRKRMAVVAGGRPARTVYRTLETFAGYTLVQAEPETGRTHQVRVHFAWLGCPLAGDPVYGQHRAGRGPAGPPQGKLPLRRQFLHAWKLRFRLPPTGEIVECTAPLPADLEEVLCRLRAISIDSEC
jgi:23S rRNA pseudouridine1911/1915/1917 synthase